MGGWEYTTVHFRHCAFYTLTRYFCTLNPIRVVKHMFKHTRGGSSRNLSTLGMEPGNLLISSQVLTSPQWYINTRTTLNLFLIVWHNYNIITNSVFIKIGVHPSFRWCFQSAGWPHRRDHLSYLYHYLQSWLTRLTHIISHIKNWRPKALVKGPTATTWQCWVLNRWFSGY